MTRRRTILAIALAACAAAGAAAGWRWHAAAPSHPTRPRPHVELRRELLADLRDRLLPAAEGGWVAESPAAPSVEGWLLAAAEAPGAGRAFERALAAAERGLDGEGDTRSLALVVAEVLPGPGRPTARTDRLAGRVLDHAEQRLDAGDAAWLAPVLQLSAGRSAASDAATQALVRRAGPPDCGRLPRPGAALPAPSGSMTVALRVLAGNRVRCPAASALLDAALTDPAWDTWVASAELADLAEVSAPLAAAQRRGLDERLAGFLAVRADQAIDLVGVVQAQGARRRLSLSAALPAPVEHHLAGQVAHRGGLAGRSSSTPTVFDLAIQRQLVGERSVPPSVLADTRAAGGSAPATGPADPVVVELLAGTGRPSCGDAPGAASARARVTFEGLVADEAWTVVRAHCRGTLDLAATVRKLRTGPHAEQRVVRIAAAELAACRLDPELVAAAPPLRVTVRGPFGTDSTVVWARAVAADPVAACAAVDRS